MNPVKFLRAPILRNICERLLLARQNKPFKYNFHLFETQIIVYRLFERLLFSLLVNERLQYIVWNKKLEFAEDQKSKKFN